jgi:formylglycine-generating enzyme required for sulfatase activity
MKCVKCGYLQPDATKYCCNCGIDVFDMVKEEFKSVLSNDTLRDGLTVNTVSLLSGKVKELGLDKDRAMERLHDVAKEFSLDIQDQGDILFVDYTLEVNTNKLYIVDEIFNIELRVTNISSNDFKDAWICVRLDHLGKSRKKSVNIIRATQSKRIILSFLSEKHGTEIVEVSLGFSYPDGNPVVYQASFPVTVLPKDDEKTSVNSIKINAKKIVGIINEIKEEENKKKNQSHQKKSSYERDSEIWKRIPVFLDENETRKRVEQVNILKAKAKTKEEASPLRCPVTCIEFVQVSDGVFNMGDIWAKGASTEDPVHRVVVKPFLISKCPVTQSNWEMVMGNNPSKFKGANFPVENVTWDDCQEFIRRLNRISGRSYRLPSEAEWEYAARSGGKQERWAGTDSLAYLHDYAWFYDNSVTGTHEVGIQLPNGLGLFDMSGNVWEWCYDTWHENYVGAPDNCLPWEDGACSSHVIRGGSWSNYSTDVRTTSRFECPSNVHRGSIGFRIVYSL